jgi:D-alanyl-D-alanine carboxypeptidase (penicillin-binding protein 5/6)
MEEPLVRKLVRRQTYHIAGDRTLHTWNDLLATYPGLYGVKTGHTDHARWSEVAAARRDGTSTWTVVLGSPTRAKRNAAVAELLDWGFDQYARYTLVRGGDRYATAAIPFSDDRLELLAAGSASSVVRLGEGTRFVERVVAPETVELPVTKGQKLGEVVVLDGERVVAREPLVAARAVSAPSLGDRLGWYADRTLEEAGDLLSSIVPGL